MTWVKVDHSRDDEFQRQVGDDRETRIGNEFKLTRCFLRTQSISSTKICSARSDTQWNVFEIVINNWSRIPSAIVLDTHTHTYTQTQIPTQIPSVIVLDTRTHRYRYKHRYQHRYLQASSYKDTQLQAHIQTQIHWGIVLDKHKQTHKHTADWHNTTQPCVSQSLYKWASVSCTWELSKV